MEELDFLKYQCIRRFFLTTWHLNDTFLEFKDIYCKDMNIQRAKNRFSYCCRKLVEQGFLKPSIRSGTGPNGILDFGVNHITTWYLSDKINRLELLSKMQNSDI